MEAQFETWWENEGHDSGLSRRDICELAWKNGVYCALNPEPVTHKECPDGPYDPYGPADDFNEPLGPACQLGDETCESCQ